MRASFEKSKRNCLSVYIMDCRSSLAILFLLTFICHSHEISPTEQPLASFYDGYTVKMKLSATSFRGEMFLQGVIEPNATISVNVDASSVQNASFLIFQVHSYVKPLVLLVAPELQNGGYVNGTDVGLYSKLDKKTITYVIKNLYSESINILLVPMLYGSEDPVPGGCNLSFPTNIAPFMTLTYQENNEIVQVDAQAASVQGQADCKPMGLSYEVYVQDVLDTSADSYFKGILSMLTAEGAEFRGLQTRLPIHLPELRRRFATYPGFGAVFVVIVRDTHTGKSAAYVPIAKYGCIKGNDENCVTYVNTEWVLIICAIAFIGAEVRYFSGGNMKVLLRTSFIMGSLITFEPALPSYFKWIFLGFMSLACVVSCIAGQVGQTLSVITEHAYALVPAHIFFGYALNAGLGMISGFQDWYVVICSFGIFFVLFYICGRLFPEHGLDSFIGIIFNVAVVSAITNGVLIYVYVDPARILRREFSDVIFSPPMSPTDYLLLLSATAVFIIYSFGRMKFHQRRVEREYREIGGAVLLPPNCVHADYNSI